MPGGRENPQDTGPGRAPQEVWWRDLDRKDLGARFKTALTDPGSIKSSIYGLSGEVHQSVDAEELLLVETNGVATKRTYFIPTQGSDHFAWRVLAKKTLPPEYADNPAKADFVIMKEGEAVPGQSRDEFSISIGNIGEVDRLFGDRAGGHDKSIYIFEKQEGVCLDVIYEEGQIYGVQRFVENDKGLSGDPSSDYVSFSTVAIDKMDRQIGDDFFVADLAPIFNPSQPEEDSLVVEYDPETHQIKLKKIINGQEFPFLTLPRYLKERDAIGILFPSPDFDNFAKAPTDADKSWKDVDYLAALGIDYRVLNPTRMKEWDRSKEKRDVTNLPDSSLIR